ncbi:MAG: hypothetical protein JOZ75_11375 [Candidatus Dormibacteraeota bacterium]|nr:hypothetical protein [Candidatus Dormibacteraeota bacterium]
MRSKISIGLLIAAGAALAAIVAGHAPAPAARSGDTAAAATVPPTPSAPALPTPPQVPASVVFHDVQGQLALAFGFDPYQASTGDFTLSLQGIGEVTGQVPMSSVTTTGGVVEANNGSADFVARGSGRPQSATISMVGTVDLVARAARLAITFQGQPYTLVDFIPPAAAAPGVAQAVAAALTQQQWSALYADLVFEQQQTLSEAEFAAAMSRPGPTVTGTQLNGLGSLDVEAGARYWHQPMAVTATPPGGSSQQYTCTMDLEAEGGQWRLLDTTGLTGA